MIVLYQMLVVQRKDVFFDFSFIRFRYQYTEFWREMPELTYFTWFYLVRGLQYEWKDMYKVDFCPVTLCNLYCPENWTKSSGREVRTNSLFPSAPLNHMNLNISETFMNHT